MKTIKPPFFALTILTFAALILVGPLCAETLIYEPFDYPTTGATNGDELHLGDETQSGALGLEGSWSTQINNIEMEVRDEAMTFVDEGGNELPVAGLSIRRSGRGGFTTNSIAVEPAVTAALTGDNTTMWMSFLFEDEGFSGPDSSVMLASEALALENNHSLVTPGYGVGILVGESGQSTASFVESGYYLDATITSRIQSTVSPNDFENETFLLAAKINWKADGTPDEIFIFNLTDLTTEPSESDAIASDTFDMPLTAQQSLDTLNIGETQIDAFDEIRFGTSFEDVVGLSSDVDPVISSFTSLGGGEWELALAGLVDGSYALYSSPDLLFDPGTLVEGLSQGNIDDAGSIGGFNDSLIILDENGLGLFRLTLPGDAPQFLRAVTAP